MTRSTIVACSLMCSSALLSGQQGPPRFRATTDVVSIEVSVRAGRSAVTDLRASDFQVLDNGVPQRLDAVLYESVPIDLTLVLDASGSTARVIERFKANARQVTDLLRPADRVQLVAVSTDVVRIVPDPPASHVLPLDRLHAAGGTSINDALLLALVAREDPQRRALVIAFTDGEDTTSATDTATVAAAAARSDGVLHVVLAPSPAGVPAPALSSPLEALRDAAETTGGALYLPGAYGDAVDAFKRVLDEFRHSYVVRYTLHGVPRDGWHDVIVSVNRPSDTRLTVRARRGYFGG
jgi:VWFA-related protein